MFVLKNHQWGIIYINQFYGNNENLRYSIKTSFLSKINFYKNFY